jgi:hypothetical protein
VPTTFQGEGAALFRDFLRVHVDLGRAIADAHETGRGWLRLRERFHASLDDGEDLTARHLFDQTQARVMDRIEACTPLISAADVAAERLAQWWLEQPEGAARVAQREEALDVRRQVEQLWQAMELDVREVLEL